MSNNCKIFLIIILIILQYQGLFSQDLLNYKRIEDFNKIRQIDTGNFTVSDLFKFMGKPDKVKISVVKHGKVLTYTDNEVEVMTVFYYFIYKCKGTFIYDMGYKDLKFLKNSDIDLKVIKFSKKTKYELPKGVSWKTTVSEMNNNPDLKVMKKEKKTVIFNKQNNLSFIFQRNKLKKILYSPPTAQPQ
jgi:hypothetical protein